MIGPVIDPDVIRRVMEQMNTNPLQEARQPEQPDMTKLHQWETILKHPETSACEVARFAVPGGWIYELADGLIFVPFAPPLTRWVDQQKHDTQDDN